MIHKFKITNGKVTFMNKLLDTVSYTKTVRDNNQKKSKINKIHHFCLTISYSSLST